MAAALERNPARNSASSTVPRDAAALLKTGAYILLVGLLSAASIYLFFGGITRQAFLDFVPDAIVGDFVMVHVGFAISKVDAEEAARTYEALEHLGFLAEEGLGVENEIAQENGA